MTVEKLINQLKKYNPKAEVRLNNHQGTIAFFAVAFTNNDNLVWIEGKDDIVIETQMDELDFFMELIDIGISLGDI